MCDSSNKVKELEAELEATKEAYKIIISPKTLIIPTKILKFQE